VNSSPFELGEFQDGIDIPRIAKPQSLHTPRNLPGVTKLILIAGRPTMSERVEFEFFEAEQPTYAPAYIMSTFLLIGLLSMFKFPHPLWPPTVAHAVITVWFGVCFRWMLVYSRQMRLYSSSRLTVTQETYSHTFHYAVHEGDFVTLPVTEIVSIQINRGADTTWIEVKATNGDDVFFLPDVASAKRVAEALTKVNPCIRVLEQP
jgi:hypothetical protein